MKQKSRLLAFLLTGMVWLALDTSSLRLVWGAGNNPPSRVFIFARGTNAALWYKTFDGTIWGPWETLGGSIKGAPDACSPNPGDLIIFARGQGGVSDKELFYKRTTLNKPPKKWESFRTKVGSDPGAACRSGGNVDVFVRGLNDLSLWHAWYESSNWANQYSIDPKPGSDEFRSLIAGIGGVTRGGAIINGPDACSWGGQRLDVFVRGTDNYIWHRYRDDQGKWHEWDTLGGLRMTSDPSAVALSKGQLSVFARGENNKVWTKTYTLNDDRWGPWLPLGGMVIAGGPDAARTSDNRVDVFARGVDNAVWHTSVTYANAIPNLKAVPAWENMGGQVTSDPSAVGVNW